VFCPRSLIHLPEVAFKPYPCVRHLHKDAIIKDDQVRRLMSRATVKGENDLDRYFPQFWPGQVQVRLEDDQSYTHEIIVPKGESGNPMSAREVEEKFLSLAAPVLGDERV
jgi:2-methylcitrate dehydratase PrpD